LADGEPVTLETFGGEAGLSSDGPALAISPAFGDVVEALVGGWPSLSDRHAALLFLREGIIRNPSHDVLSHALDALSSVAPGELRPVMLALDARARDGVSSALCRAAAAAGLLRFALRDARWRSAALSSILVLEDIQDGHAGPLVCRLASLAYEQFHDPAQLDMLDRLAEHPETASQASFERGLVEIGSALDQGDLPSVCAGLGRARSWFDRAGSTAEDRRDARVYLLLLDIVLPVAEGRPFDDQASADRLREEVSVRALWDMPAPGAEWLLPPLGSESAWLPLADDLVSISRRLREPSWLEAGRVLGDVVDVYSAVRSVRPDFSKVVRPAIEAAFLRERGLLAHLDHWLLQAETSQLDTADAKRLRENISARGGAPRGKAPRTARPGRGQSSDQS
jgi:hypothetical protein